MERHQNADGPVLTTSQLRQKKWARDRVAILWMTISAIGIGRKPLGWVRTNIEFEAHVSDISQESYCSVGSGQQSARLQKRNGRMNSSALP
jgi:hypothetical protein